MEISIEELKALTSTTITGGTTDVGIVNDPCVGRFCVVRTYSAGVFAGIVEQRVGREAVVTDAIRIWRWEGAASLSQLATEGPKVPSGCKFGVPVTVTLTEVIEVIPCTSVGEAAIRAVPSWRI